MLLSRAIIKRCSLGLGAALVLSLAAFLACKPALLDDVSFSRAVFDRKGNLLRLTLSKDEKYRLFTPLEKISPALRDAALLHEDQYFYQHPGINPAALFRAAGQTLFGGRKIGASTITMQLARLKSGMNTRHIPGKLWQMLSALRLELHYGKDELLTAYLNLASYGYNIEGVGAASMIYFHRQPDALTLPEALSLTVIPQSPTRRRPEQANPAKPALVQARNRLFARWLALHPEAADQKLYFALPLATQSIADLPFAAPHLAQHLLVQSRNPQIHATIDRDIQQMLEGILRRYVDDRSEVGINNASAILVDTRSMQTIASIGSADFRNVMIGGQIDGTRARRSPGSTLKPFIYALGFDQGLIHPMSVLGDAPTRFGSYAPDNFDRDFRGPVSAHDALRLSRNIPALKIAAQLRSPDLYSFFTTAGIGGLRPKDDYGLSLVLGGAEVTMRELAALYAMLANDGTLRPLAFELTDTEPAPSKTMLSAEASFMTLDILRDTPRPFRAETEQNIYWKTGTSNGFHDAWTAGIFGPYALVVWVGNFSGKNNPALVGVRTAAPLFFALADALRGQAPLPELIAGKADKLRLRKIDVCATTGDLSLTGCPSLTQSWFIPGVSPIQKHDVYRKILVNLKTGKRACQAVAGETGTRTFEIWPSDLQQTLRQAGIEQPPLPEWDESCANQAEQAGQKPVIVSPQPNLGYYARLHDDGNEAIMLNATADGAARELHWFINSRYLGKSTPQTGLAWHPRPGKYAVRVVDDFGRSSSLAKVQILLAP